MGVVKKIQKIFKVMNNKPYVRDNKEKNKNTKENIVPFHIPKSINTAQKRLTSNISIVQHMRYLNSKNIRIINKKPVTVTPINIKYQKMKEDYNKTKDKRNKSNNNIVNFQDKVQKREEGKKYRDSLKCETKYDMAYKNFENTMRRKMYEEDMWRKRRYRGNMPIYRNRRMEYRKAIEQDMLRRRIEQAKKRRLQRPVNRNVQQLKQNRKNSNNGYRFITNEHDR